MGNKDIFESNLYNFIEVIKSKISYEHRQVIPKRIWKVVHNLGRNPSVNIIDSAGESWITQVDYLNENELEIKFSSEMSGTAYLN